MSKKKYSIRVTHADCEFTFTKGGGPGGQNVNKRNTKCRCFHRPSGATGVSADERSAEQNKRTAFVRMAHTDTFTKWAHLEAARLSGRLAEADDNVRRALAAHNLRLEVKDADGRWQPVALDAPLDIGADADADGHPYTDADADGRADAGTPTPTRTPTDADAHGHADADADGRGRTRKNLLVRGSR